MMVSRKKAAMDGVIDLDNVLPVFGDLEEKDWIGMEAVAVRVAGRETLGLSVDIVRLARDDLPVEHGGQRNIRRQTVPLRST
jgi:hypothetical protein